jgi:hypothetical protein
MMSDGGGHGHTMLRGYGTNWDAIVVSIDGKSYPDAFLRVDDVD